MALTTPPFQPTYLNLEYIFYKIYQLFQSIYDFLTSTDLFAKLFVLLKVLLVLAAILAIAVIAYSIVRIQELKEQEQKKLKTFIVKEPIAGIKNDKWEMVLAHARSANSSDWRLAIIEADTILDDMIRALGYQGEDLGSRLKSIEPSDFLTLDEAWEAHKIRNRIAHDGSAFPLDQKEALRVIGLYERVFKEFKFI
jgi:hypothetical protein